MPVDLGNLSSDELQRDVRSLTGRERDVRRFGVAAAAGVALTAVPFFWVLCDQWTDSPNLLRTAWQNGYASNFYDLQARAMFAGHLYVPKGSLSVEAFVHNGREYTYFGLFPSLLRMPVLLLTHSLDGRLTALSMVVAWLVTGLFSSLLVWRVRILVRGSTALGRAEAAALGVLIASITGGSVLMFLAANPFVFSEDLAWSVAVTVGSLFALLGVLELPSRGRIAASGALILAASLTRGPTGYACVIGAALVATWFASGHGGAQNRRWWLPVLAAGLIPVAVSCAVSFAKFGILFGYPAADALGTKVLGVGVFSYSFGFLPSNLSTYLNPGGVQLTSVFPFIILPADPAATASLPASMPLLFLFGLWGVAVSFRPRPIGGLRAVRTLLFAAATGAGAVLLFGTIANRFLADFLPFLVLGAAVGLADTWYRLEGRSRQLRGFALALIASIGLFSIVANFGIASTPSRTWSHDQVVHYVETQKSISDVTGHPLTGNLERGYQVPGWSPANQLFVGDDCADLYISDGEGIGGLGYGWLLVERAPDQSLCRSLISDQHLTQEQMASFTRCYTAIKQANTSFQTWEFTLALRGKNARTSQIVDPTNTFISALREYDATIKSLVVSGGSETRVVALGRYDRSLEDELSSVASQTESSVAQWRMLALTDWAKVNSAGASLLTDLGSPSAG